MHEQEKINSNYSLKIMNPEFAYEALDHPLISFEFLALLL